MSRVESDANRTMGRWSAIVIPVLAASTLGFEAPRVVEHEVLVPDVEANASIVFWRTIAVIGASPPFNEGPHPLSCSASGRETWVSNTCATVQSLGDIKSSLPLEDPITSRAGPTPIEYTFMLVPYSMGVSESGGEIPAADPPILFQTPADEHARCSVTEVA